MQEGDKVIESFSHEDRHYEPPKRFAELARVNSLSQYEELYRESLDQPEAFWKRETQDLIFRKRWNQLLDWTPPFAKWFLGAELNASESCLDRHVREGRGDKLAILWESETGEVSRYSYAELTQEVRKLSAALRAQGVGKGDRVAIYMGMVPEAVIGMLACARIGAPHTVVFGGFAADALRARVSDCSAKAVLTQDGALRRGNVVPLKQTVDVALEGIDCVEAVFVLARLGAERCPITLVEGRDLDWRTTVDAADPTEGAPEIVDAEHPLFILYTSGSTGKPKGILHTTAGYLAGVHVTSKYVFDLRETDVYWCTADVGWITGHSYVTYGPLSCGATCLLYEGAPNEPDWGRFWDIIEKHRVSILYTAPTAIRAFIQAGDAHLNNKDLSSLRLLGTVGEPINPEAWTWFYEKIGKRKCPVVDTWWQTETGGVMMTTLPGVHAVKPGACGVPFFGVEPAILGTDGQERGAGEGGLLVLKRPWPSIMRNVWGDPDRFQKQYFDQVPGMYFTGDGARRDEDGYFTVVGRIDDVLNVAGHRIGTAEIESSLVAHAAVAEAAAVGRPDDLKGQALVVFVTLIPGRVPSPELRDELGAHVGKEIGKFARPQQVVLVDGLPKTRSGKIMRRLLKAIAAGDPVTGDTSTLEDPDVVARCQAAFQES